MRMTKRSLAVAGLALGLLAGCASPADVPLDGLVDIGTHQLYIRCVGTGRPTVVIDTGVGETAESWESVVDALAESTRVCTYDRAGYGRSEPGPMPRDGQRAADELHRLLLESGEDGPFVLVGHSLGGLNMQVFAATYPEQVVGAVLLDPSPLAWIQGEGFPELVALFEQETAGLRVAAEAAGASADPKERAQAPFLEALASEYEEVFGGTGRQVGAISSFGQLPLTVIGATEPEPGFGEYADAFRQFWNEESQKLAAKSEQGRFVLAQGSSHHIHLDAPQLVIDEVLALVEEARD